MCDMRRTGVAVVVVVSMLLSMSGLCSGDDKPAMPQGRVVRAGKNPAAPGTPENPITFIEMGSNNGKWMDFKMNETVEKKQSARCFTFEPQPHLVNGPLGIVAKRHNCTLIPQPVWTEVKTMTFNRHANDEASSLFGGGAWEDKSKSKTFEIASVDIVDFMVANFDPKGYIYGRMDVEGAEYTVLRHMFVNGVACWFDILELEFHALHHGSNYYMRPADVVLPWMLHGCGVQVKTEAWYPDNMIKANDPCAACDNLKMGFDMEGAGKKQHEADEAAKAAAAAGRRMQF